MRQSLQLLFKRVNIPETKLPPWDWGFALGMVGIYLFAFFGTVWIASSAANDQVDTLDPGVLAWATLMGCLMTLILLGQYLSITLERRQENTPAPQKMTLIDALRLYPSQNTPLWVILFLVFALAIFANTIGLILGVPLDSLPAPLSGVLPTDTLPFLAGIMVVLVLRPVVEEIIFRGLLYTTLIKHVSHWQAIGISSVGFALLHYALDPTYLWWGLVLPFILGLVAGITRAATQSTQAAIGAHVMFGVFVVLRAILY